MHEKRYGTTVASRWRSLVDDLDDVWQTVRKLGWEAELTGKAELTGPVRRRIRHEQTVADLAQEIDHPHLAAVLRASAYRQGGDPETTPAWCAVTQSIERRFGRWTLQSDCAADQQDRTGRTSTLVDALIARARLRRVDLRLDERVDVLDIEQGRVTGRGDHPRAGEGRRRDLDGGSVAAPRCRAATADARGPCAAICGGCDPPRRRR